MRTLLIVAALLAAASGASAADLPPRGAEPSIPAVAPPASNWTGIYAGINGGYAFGANSSYALSGTAPGDIAAIATGTRPSTFTTRAKGFAGGGQVGYNRQIGNGFGGLAGGNLVAGIEADVAYTDLPRINDFYGPNGLRDTNFQSRTDFVGTVRGRIGMAFGDLLVFGTGGFAYGGVKNAINFYTGPVFNHSGAVNSIRAGYAYGGGIEYVMPTASFLNPLHASAVTLKVEYMHYDLGTTTVVANSLLGAANNTYIARVQSDGNLIRVGLNYKIDIAASPAPVVARY